MIWRKLDHSTSEHSSKGEEERNESTSAKNLVEDSAAATLERIENR